MSDQCFISMVLRYYIPNMFYPDLEGSSGLYKSHTFLAKTGMWLEPLFLGFSDRGSSEEACFRAGERRKLDPHSFVWYCFQVEFKLISKDYYAR